MDCYRSSLFTDVVIITHWIITESVRSVDELWDSAVTFISQNCSEEAEERISSYKL